MVKKLEDSGFAVKGVFDGESGLSEIEKNPPTLILLDILLPGIDGFEVLKRLKTDDRFRHIPVVIISNLTEESAKKRALQDGAIFYIVKAETSPREIAEKVQALIKNSQKS